MEKQKAAAQQANLFSCKNYFIFHLFFDFCVCLETDLFSYKQPLSIINVKQGFFC